MNPSPLRYPGGKHKLYDYISNLMVENQCTTYIEPFAGGSALSLGLLFNGIAKKVIINDYDYTIYCFWYSILNYTEEFVNKVETAEINMDEWYRQKEIRENVDDYSILDVGFSTFFLNRTNRSGVIDKAGPIGGYNQSGNYKIDCRFNKNRLIRKIRKIAEYKNVITVTNLEAIDFINKHILKTRNSFSFFDPPYYNKGPGLYTNFYQHGDHENLSKIIFLKLKNRKWIVSYDNVNEIKSMYRSVNSLVFGLQYSLQEKRSCSEVMFFSKKVIRPVDENVYLEIINEAQEI